jgi:LmbE family N-acetylglucosaminyl deacetylase
VKIIVFAPHPDDEIYGCGGSILKWIDESHEVHLIYISDNSAIINWAKKRGTFIETEENKNLTEEDLSVIGLQEAKEAAKFLGIPKERVHLFEFPDSRVKAYINKGVEIAKTIVKNADRFVIPSANNEHPDHQATYDIAVKVAQELNLKNLEFYVYALYNPLRAEGEHLIKIKIGDLRFKLYDALKIYKSQFWDKEMYRNSLWVKGKRRERFGYYKLSHVGKFYNF